MATTIEDVEIRRLARELAELTGEEPIEAARAALQERLERERGKRAEAAKLVARLTEIARHCAALPDLDTRSPDEIIGYDEHGAPC